MLIAENKDIRTKYHYESTRMQFFLNFEIEKEMTTVTRLSVFLSKVGFCPTKSNVAGV